MNFHKVNNEQSSKLPFPAKDVLLQNGWPTIVSCNYNKAWSGCIFLEADVLLVVKTGRLKFRYGDTVCEVAANQMVYLKKDVVIYFEADQTPEIFFHVEYLLFVLRQEVIKEYIKLAQLSIQVKKTATVEIYALDNRLTKYIDSVDLCFVKSEKVDSRLVKIKLLELLFYLSGQYQGIIEQLLDLKDNYRADFTAVVEENVLNSITLDELARLSGRSLSSFRRDFRAMYKMPVSKWIRRKRLEKAQQLLASTTMTVTEVCYTAGFENLTHFSKLFKFYLGYPPSAFRQQMQFQKK